MMADPYHAPVMPDRAPRLALCRTRLWNKAQPEGRAVLEAAAKLLAKAGAEIVDSELPPVCDEVSEVQRRHSAFEAPRNHAPELYRHKALLSHDLLGDGRIESGRRLSLADFRTAWRDADRMRAAAHEWAAGFDAILTLPAAGEAPRTLDSTGPAVFNALWTVLHMPCLTLPGETGPNGLPVGIQLVGPRYRDARLIDIGLWVERALGGRA
jgi:Asp-tRNA(Asn)/Glu-tRNA(Gln) amidotransferase A subunit family amidase